MLDAFMCDVLEFRPADIAQYAKVWFTREGLAGRVMGTGAFLGQWGQQQASVFVSRHGTPPLTTPNAGLTFADTCIASLVPACLRLQGVRRRR